MARPARKVITDYREEAIKLGALDAHRGLPMNPAKNRQLQRHLHGLHGKYKVSVATILEQGYTEGYQKAEAYFMTL